MTNDLEIIALLKRRHEQLEKQLKDFEKMQTELKNIEKHKKEIEALEAEKEKIQKEQKEILKQLDNEQKKEIKKQAVEEIAQSMLSIQEAIQEKNTEKTIGIADKLEINHTLATDPVSSAAIGMAAAAAYASKKVAEIKEKLSEKDAGKEWKKDIQERGNRLKEKYDRQTKILEQNQVMLESQLKDAKKEGYKGKIDQLEKTIRLEKEKLEKMYQHEQEELKSENEKLEEIEKEYRRKSEAIKSEQQKTVEQKEREQRELEKARQEEIDKQRKEMGKDKQREITR